MRAKAYNICNESVHSNTGIKNNTRVAEGRAKVAIGVCLYAQASASEIEGCRFALEQILLGADALGKGDNFAPCLVAKRCAHNLDDLASGNSSKGATLAQCEATT